MIADSIIKSSFVGFDGNKYYPGENKCIVIIGFYSSIFSLL